MASPLRKRTPRELRNNAGKYLGLFFMMVVAIGITSGFMAASYSIGKIVDEMRDTYVVEDGRFTCAYEASDDAFRAVEDLGTSVYETFSYDLDFKAEDGAQNAVARVYVHREDVNLAAYAEGSAPASDDEIAVDRVFAEHNDIAVGDSVTVGSRSFTVCGIMTLPDYQALFENNGDFVFNSLTFTVAEVTSGAFDAFADDGEVPAYTYSFVMDDRAMAADERADVEADMTEALSDEGVTVTDFLDADANQGIGYAADDIEGDRSMWETLSLLLIAIMGFMFAVLIGSTIEEESAVIGTLLASGWRKRELVAHYMTLPCIIGVLAATVGNVLGYAALVDAMKGLYYNSYSLPPYVATWSWEAFALTTAAPLALLIGITLVGLVLKMRRTPLQFLRHDLGRGGTKRGVSLPERLGFTARFRLRVFLRNLGNFVTLFCGIAFASLLFLFGTCMMPTMENYADSMRDTVPAEHLYTLKSPVEIDGTAEEREAWAAVQELARVESPDDLGLSQADLLELMQQAATADTDGHPVNTLENSDEPLKAAEKYGVYSLEYDRGGDSGTEAVTVYGVAESSRYWTDVTVGNGAVTLGTGMAQKFGLGTGSTVVLYDKYQDEEHSFTVTAVSGSASDMNLYVSLADFNDEFGNDADYFNGYASDEELAIDSLYLQSELTPDDMDKIAVQMTESMADMCDMMVGLAVVISLVFMYLLTKTVIDRSARAISYMKVFGYRDREINRLYLRSITWTVATSLVLCLPLLIGILSVVFRSMLYDYNGNVEIYVPATMLVANVAAGIAAYTVVAALHVRSIKRVPLSIALKVQE